jgi:signal transduction histidine kinase
MPQPHFQPVKLEQLVADVAKLHQAQLAQAKIACDLQLAESIDPIAADPDLLHRAISNLVLNAIEAMPRGGKLTLRSRQNANAGHIGVSDSGKGLTLEECASLFTPYYTNKVYGTGLGLAIVQSIVSDHGGKISVSSEPGCGATFIIELPANRDKLQAAQGTHV